jgi:energy-coupling factor transporter transmembrane protein EcfT
MDLYIIDYISVSNRSVLHRAPAAAKMIALAAIITLLLVSKSAQVNASIALAVMIIAALCRIPLRVLVPLMLYPTVFLVVLFLSVRGLTVLAVMMLGTRVLAIAGSVVLFILSTSFPAVFGTLGRVLPGFLVAALFFTYRAIFVIADSMNDMRIALHLRGGIDWKHPISSVGRFGAALGHFLVHSIERSERMAESLEVRGFADRLYYMDLGR